MLNKLLPFRSIGAVAEGRTSVTWEGLQFLDLMRDRRLRQDWIL